MIILAKWPWPSLKGHRKINIALVWDIDVENIPVKFWKESNIPERVIMLTKYLDTRMYRVQINRVPIKNLKKDLGHNIT